VLLHIGPYKTGSTALQSSLFAARSEFAEHAVYYPGRWRRAAQQSWSVLRRSPRGRPPPKPVKFWKSYAADIRAHSDMRVCVSSEDFGPIREFRAREVVEDLGGQRVHVVAVARRLDRLLPSAWQERVKGHDSRTYETWLREILEDESSSANTAFWRSHDIAKMTAEWLPVVGPERFHVIVADDTDRNLLNRVFESLLALPEGLLKPAEVTNSSLSANACELIRRINQTFDDEEWTDEQYHATVYKGAIAEMISAGRAPSDMPIPRLPDWARGRVVELSHKRIDDLAATGVQVIGEPIDLIPPADQESDPGDTATPSVISIDQATAALIGAIRGAVRRESTIQATGSDEIPSLGSGSEVTDLSMVPARALIGATLQRVPQRFDRFIRGK